MWRPFGEQVFLKAVSKLNSVITDNFGEREEVEKLYARSKPLQPVNSVKIMFLSIKVSHN